MRPTGPEAQRANRLVPNGATVAPGGCYREGTAELRRPVDELLVPPPGCIEQVVSNPESKESNNLSQSFSALGVSADVIEALASNGIHEPFNIQTLALPDALAGLDILGKAP